MENKIGPVHDFYKVLSEQWQPLRLAMPTGYHENMPI